MSLLNFNLLFSSLFFNLSNSLWILFLFSKKSKGSRTGSSSAHSHSEKKKSDIRITSTFFLNYHSISFILKSISSHLLCEAIWSYHLKKNHTNINKLLCLSFCLFMKYQANYIMLLVLLFFFLCIWINVDSWQMPGQVHCFFPFNIQIHITYQW